MPHTEAAHAIWGTHAAGWPTPEVNKYLVRMRMRITNPIFTCDLRDTGARPPGMGRLWVIPNTWQGKQLPCLEETLMEHPKMWTHRNRAHVSKPWACNFVLSEWGLFLSNAVEMGREGMRGRLLPPVPRCPLPPSHMRSHHQRLACTTMGLAHNSPASLEYSGTGAVPESCTTVPLSAGPYAV